MTFLCNQIFLFVSGRQQFVILCNHFFLSVLLLPAFFSSTGISGSVLDTYYIFIIGFYLMLKSFYTSWDDLWLLIIFFLYFDRPITPIFNIYLLYVYSFLILMQLAVFDTQMFWISISWQLMTANSLQHYFSAESMLFTQRSIMSSSIFFL